MWLEGGEKRWGDEISKDWGVIIRIGCASQQGFPVCSHCPDLWCLGLQPFPFCLMFFKHYQLCRFPVYFMAVGVHVYHSAVSRIFGIDCVPTFLQSRL